MRHALVFLLLLSSALSFSQHRVGQNGQHTASKPEHHETDSTDLKDEGNDGMFQKIIEENVTMWLATRDEKRQQVYAFSAELSVDRQIASGSTIVFDNVLINEGGLYFGNSGQFACPDQGVYVFMWSVRQTGSQRGLAELVFGGQSIKSGPQTSYYASGIENGNSQMMSVIQCRTSPLTAVTVRSTFPTPPTYTAAYTSFSGFRLALDDASTVAFTAELSWDASLFPRGRIMFDHVVSNIGERYDNLNGYFRCPDDGLYSFTVSAYYPSADNKWSVAKLMYNGEPVLQGPVTFRSTTSWDSGSSSLTVLHQCEQDKDVYVEAAESFTFEYTTFGATLTSFSGFRLCDTCDTMVAFSAVLTQNVTASGVDVALGRVLVNNGNAYDAASGVFTCPDAGFYAFQWSATGAYCYCNLDLYVNGIRHKQSYLTRTMSNAGVVGTSGTSSQTVVLGCTVGAKVSLRGTGVTTAKIILAGHTTFSGYRLPAL